MGRAHRALCVRSGSDCVGWSEKRCCLKTLFLDRKRHGYRPIWLDIRAVFDGCIIKLEKFY